MLADIKDAVTARAFPLICGVALQLGFIASYIRAFHHPAPHRVPVAVVAPAPVAPRVVRQWGALPGTPLHATRASSQQAAITLLRERTRYGVLAVSPATQTDGLTVASASGPPRPRL